MLSFPFISLMRLATPRQHLFELCHGADLGCQLGNRRAPCPLRLARPAPWSFDKARISCLHIGRPLIGLDYRLSIFIDAHHNVLSRPQGSQSFLELGCSGLLALLCQRLLMMFRMRSLYVRAQPLVIGEWIVQLLLTAVYTIMFPT